MDRRSKNVKRGIVGGQRGEGGLIVIDREGKIPYLSFGKNKERQQGVERKGKTRRILGAID